jgi:hypothetical protein
MTGFRAPRWTRALTLGVPVVLAGCGIGGLFGGDDGRVRLVLSGETGGSSSAFAANIVAGSDDRDKDGNKGDERLSLSFESARVTLSSVLFRTLDGELVPVDMDLPVTVDVVRLEGGRAVTLPDGIVPTDTYDQVVIVMTAVQGTTRDGTVVTIEPPGGGWTSVIPQCPIEVAEGSTETVSVRLMTRSSFVRLSDRWGFAPRFLARTNCDD